MGSLFLYRQTGEGRTGLLKSRAERGSLVDLYAKSVALESGIQIIVLSGTMINTETRSDNGLSMERVRSPSQSDPRIKVLVVGIVQSRILGTGRSVNRTSAGWYWQRVERPCA